MKWKLWPVLVCVASLLPSAVSAAELTATDVVKAHREGVVRDTLVRLIESSSEVAPLTPSDEAMLRDAGVPDSVIAAYMRRTVTAGREETGEQGPDDQRLAELVKLVRAGLSEDLVVDHVRHVEPPFEPTVDDLIYLKREQVPEAVISAVLGEGAREVGPVPDVPAAQERAAPSAGPIQSFEPLTRFSKMAGVLTRKTDGRFMIVGGKLQWIDEEQPDLSFEIFDSVLKKVTLECEAASCFEIRLKTVHGDKYRFRDADWKVGGNSQVMALWEALKAQHPKVKFQRKE